MKAVTLELTVDEESRLSRAADDRDRQAALEVLEAALGRTVDALLSPEPVAKLSKEELTEIEERRRRWAEAVAHAHLVAAKAGTPVKHPTDRADFYDEHRE